MSNDDTTEHHIVAELLHKLAEDSDKIGAVLESSESFEKDIRSRHFVRPVVVTTHGITGHEHTKALVERTNTVISSSESFRQDVRARHAEKDLRRSLWKLKR